MKKLIVLLIAALTTLSFASLSFAQAKPVETAVQEKAAEPAKPEAPKAAKPRSLTGEVVSADSTAKTLVVKKMVKGEPKEFTFVVEEKASPKLAALTTGDQVRVTYVKADEKLIAKSIRSVKRAIKK
jgi:Cu/Ag efflux protein CusF